MASNTDPLYYAILKCFLDGVERSADDVVAELEPAYGRYKLLTGEAVEEALSAAKENGLLEESNYLVEKDASLKVYFRISEFGREMIEKYVG